MSTDNDTADNWRYNYPDIPPRSQVTAEKLREEYWLLVEMRLDPYHTESVARSVAAFAQEKILALRRQLDKAQAQLKEEIETSSADIATGHVAYLNLHKRFKDTEARVGELEAQVERMRVVAKAGLYDGPEMCCGDSAEASLDYTCTALKRIAAGCPVAPDEPKIHFNRDEHGRLTPPVDIQTARRPDEGGEG